MILLLLLYLLCYIQPGLPKQTSYEIYADYLQAPKVPYRIIQLMETYAQRGYTKVESMTKIRGQYEESPHFELGYIVSELLERYRKLIENTKRPIDWPNDAVFDVVKRNEIVQKLFFEIFHMVNMVHELPRKYSNNTEFTQPIPEKETVNHYLEEAKERIKFHEKEREREKKRHRKEVMQSQVLEEVVELGGTRKPRRPRNKYWPIDYGWEIDYYW